MPRALKDDRIDLRPTPEVKEIIANAARISGQSLADFALDAALGRAREVIGEPDRISLSERDYARVLDALDAPPDPSPALIRAAERSKTTFE